MTRFNLLFIASTMLGFGLLLPCAANAQNEDTISASTLARSYQAKHRAWLEDVKRWRAEHEQGEEVLEAMLEQFGGDSQINRHMSHIEQHGEFLGDASNDAGAMADEHARRRSIHEEMREAHHHLMDAIRMLERSVERNMGPTDPEGDDQTGE